MRLGVFPPELIDSNPTSFSSGQKLMLQQPVGLLSMPYSQCTYYECISLLAALAKRLESNWAR